MVISIYPFLYFLDLKSYKLRPLRSDPRSLHFSLIFFIYYSRTNFKFLKNRSGTTLKKKKNSQKSIWDNFIKKINFSEIYLGQLYKRNYHPLVYPYFKTCNYKKGTVWIILCVLIFVTIKKELWDTHFYSIFILDVFYNEIF